MNLLVTGGCGFIGSNVIRHVIDRPGVARLVNLDALTYAGHLETVADVQAHPKYQFVRADLRDKSAVRQVVRGHDITHVLHLAAESHVDRSIASPGIFIETNVLGTFHLIEACREHWGPAAPGGRFVHVSTDEVFGSLAGGGAFTEASAFAPNSPYAASKAAGDLLVRAAHRTHGFPAVITRASNNFGPFQYPEKLVPVAIRNLASCKPVPVYGDGLHVRDWLFVRDHAEALWRAVERGGAGESYNIGARNELTNLQLVERVCDLVDELRPRQAGSSRQLISFVADRPGHDRRYAMDPAKIERELGWRPAHRFDDALRETVRWYLENPEWIRTVTAKTPDTGPGIGPGKTLRGCRADGQRRVV
ncbi:MAG: dTDP-glucose 4,6-dehydratase [Verrucomicrobia bacterium]|nr:dTDP-glucose 4,6-dehydratase [Verrucomicrobiota bacterium]